jgi:enoyl-CoA hydratase
MGSGSELLRIEESEGLVRLILANPPVNALSPEFVDVLSAALRGIAERSDVKVVHIRSELRIFGAGGDIKFIGDLLTAPEPAVSMRNFVREVQRLLRQLEQLPAITVCQLDGGAFGGGLEVALACDFRVAAEGVMLALPETGLGLIPAGGGSQRLTRLVGYSFARQMILLAKKMDAATALKIGLVDVVLPPNEIADGTERLIETLLAKPRAALLAAKTCIAEAIDPAGSGFDLELQYVGELLETADTRRLIAQFVQASSTR